jgi:hypothetical protein
MKSLVIKTISTIALTTVSFLAPPIYVYGADATTKSPSTTSAPASGNTPVGRVVWIKGNFSAEAAKDKTPRPLQKLSLIYLKDTLVTDNNSQAQIAFTDNTLMTFRPNSKFLIDQYQFNPQKANSSGKYVMDLIQGGFRTITGLIAKRNPTNYQVKTPVATIGVRGTDYAVYLDNKGELFIGNYSGTPCVDNKKGNLCLDDKKKYAQVSSDTAPIPVSQTPAGLKDKLEIVPARIAYGPSDSGMMPGGGGFCIIQ